MTPEVISAVHTGQTFPTLKKCRQSFLVDKAQHETQPHSWVAEQQRALGTASLQHTHTQHYLPQICSWSPSQDRQPLTAKCWFRHNPWIRPCAATIFSRPFQKFQINVPYNYNGIFSPWGCRRSKKQQHTYDAEVGWCESQLPQDSTGCWACCQFFNSPKNLLK